LDLVRSFGFGCSPSMSEVLVLHVHVSKYCITIQYTVFTEKSGMGTRFSLSGFGFGPFIWIWMFP
jgi:hypothetical protein